MLKRYLAVIIFIFVSTVVSAEKFYDADTGDKQLDQVLANLNKKVGKRTRQFLLNLANEYAVPPSTLETLMKIHEFTPADCFLTVAIADASGQPIHDISRARIENKDKGWRYITYQLRIKKGSLKFNQIKHDANLPFIK